MNYSKYKIIKKVFVLFGVIFTIASLTISCKPTPTKKIVISKNDGNLEKAISNTSQPVSYTGISTSDIWSKVVLNKSQNNFIRIDAEILIPNTVSFPVISIEPSSFTQKQIDDFIKHFSINGVIYCSNEELTKEKILKKIMTIQLEYSKFKNGDDGFDSSTSDKSFEQQIKKYKALLETAPTISEHEKGSSQLVVDSETMREGLEVKIDTGNSELTTFMVRNRSLHDYSSTISLNNGKRFCPRKELYGKDALDLKLTIEKAKEYVLQTLKSLGLDDYCVKEVFTGDLLDDHKQQGYMIICTPKVNDVQVTYSFMTKIKDPNIILNNSDGRLIYKDTGETVECVPRRFDECYIEMCVNDTGVTSFIWNNIYNTLSIKNKNVQLKDFEEIKQIFLQQMKSNFSFSNKEDGIVYVVDRIELGLVTIPQRNKMGFFLLVPAWTFYGSCENSDGTPIDYPGRDFKYSSHLTINAIDGSLIVN